jgi:hypothetical protein
LRAPRNFGARLIFGSLLVLLAARLGLAAATNLLFPRYSHWLATEAR